MSSQSGAPLRIRGFEVRIGPSKYPMPRFSITVEARTPEPLGRVVEVLALKYPPLKATYSREQRSVTLRMLDRLIGIYESGLVTFCAESLEDAETVLEEIEKVLEEARRELSALGPPNSEEVEKWNKLSALELYKYLPKANCGECGETTCVAFATRVLAGERKLYECPLLERGEHRALVEKLRRALGDRMVGALGWPAGRA